MTLTVHVDGSCRDELVWSGVGVVAFADGEVVASLSASIVPSLPHVTEAEAVFHGLRLARKLGAREVLVCTDSESTAGLINAEPTGPLRPWSIALRQQWRREARTFDVARVAWLRRAENRAHSLARAGLPKEAS